ncbi:hypothetical protein BN14_09908 [Rhizoctonia solani AG-1 IB]|uniref:Uncharacterized protein n=1 Tax=Thanatephorus cucumeris (strain AG1-IB / isolate 7/3/14) TaxID=1108050 RepID=M5C746_THACB|nr:hypothetical protein BN14_09908 [Rhizoctonia solani AG-1 IB]
MRFVDRDIMIQYHGEGVGHHTGSMKAHADIQEDVPNRTEEYPNQQEIPFDEHSKNNDDENNEDVMTEAALATELVGDEPSDEDEGFLSGEDYDSGYYKSKEDMEPVQYEY